MSNNKPEFYVVQIIDSYFGDIGNYVCVPYTWIIHTEDHMALVAYPYNEDRSVTRHRVKKKEKCDSECRYYIATVEYESDTYRDAQQWIATKKELEFLVKKEIKTINTLPRIPVNENSNRSINEGNYSQGIKKPDKINRISKSLPNMTAVSITAEEPSISVERTTQPNRYNNQEYILDSGSSSLELFAQIYTHINEALRLLSIKKSFQNSKKNLALDHLRCGTQVEMIHIRKKTDRVIRDNERAFYVVQFIESPFEGIDDYVCVPYTWIIVHKAKDQKAAVVYPDDEDPTVTRYRVKRKERYNEEWSFYMAAVKYESDTYRDAEKWIATRNNCGTFVKKGSKTNDTQPKIQINENQTKYTQSEEAAAASNCNESTEVINRSMKGLTHNISRNPKENIASARVTLLAKRRLTVKKPSISAEQITQLNQCN